MSQKSEVTCRISTGTPGTQVEALHYVSRGPLNQAQYLHPDGIWRSSLEHNGVLSGYHKSEAAAKGMAESYG